MIIQTWFQLGARRLMGFAAALLLALALPVQAQSDSPVDPLESMNRAVFGFNEALDRAVLKPLAQVYVDVVPETPRRLFRNFVSNLLEPWNAVNNLLQGKPAAAASDVARFAFNTLTTLGLDDPATELGLARSNEDLGQTLGVWGLARAPIWCCPFLARPACVMALAESATSALIHRAGSLMGKSLLYSRRCGLWITAPRSSPWSG